MLAWGYVPVVQSRSTSTTRVEGRCVRGDATKHSPREAQKLGCSYVSPVRGWGYKFPGLGPGYGRWLCVNICGHCSAFPPRHVVYIGPPGIANGHVRAYRKVGHDVDFSTKNMC